MYGTNDADKVVTIRISESEYQQIKAIIDSRRYHWPRVTISSKIRQMIIFCLTQHPDKFKED